MTNQELYDAALKAIQNLYADLSVSSSVALENLATLRNEIDNLIESLGDVEDD